ncbi:Edc1p SCDLUD_002300 [Saccharomycodes ludwigii]|uniref:Edc1p n=1 Tax=Saccharomycodes ludwigii TaxID=36035 RepID=UPI001E86CA5D|nr:hypothetical protein SCDLUD_002300 [Saccharomycodes ludwigii]KAH3900846.1 hypothetical protein SCDLUD_002300 [Saccharomycodes ludwigii]
MSTDTMYFNSSRLLRTNSKNNTPDIKTKSYSPVHNITSTNNINVDNINNNNNNNNKDYYRRRKNNKTNSTGKDNKFSRTNKNVMIPRIQLLPNGEKPNFGGNNANNHANKCGVASVAFHSNSNENGNDKTSQNYHSSKKGSFKQQQRHGSSDNEDVTKKVKEVLNLKGNNEGLEVIEGKKQSKTNKKSKKTACAKEETTTAAATKKNKITTNKKNKSVSSGNRKGSLSSSPSLSSSELDEKLDLKPASEVNAASAAPIALESPAISNALVVPQQHTPVMLPLNANNVVSPIAYPHPHFSNFGVPPMFQQMQQQMQQQMPNFMYYTDMNNAPVFQPSPNGIFMNNNGVSINTPPMFTSISGNILGPQSQPPTSSSSTSSTTSSMFINSSTNTSTSTLKHKQTTTGHNQSQNGVQYAGASFASNVPTISKLPKPSFLTS